MTHHQDDLEDDFDYEDEDNQQTDAIPDTIRGFVFSAICILELNRRYPKK